MGPLLPCQAPSPLQAQIPGLLHHPAEFLDPTHCTSTKPHLATSCPCLLSCMYMLTPAA